MRLLFVGILCAACAPSVEAAAAEAEIVTYKEMCDASAAVALDNDHFVVADDEMNTLRIYKRGQPSSVRQVDLSKFLDTKPDKESDLEGAARIGDVIYWISSHGTNKDGKIQDRRKRFFATQIDTTSSPPAMKPMGKAYSKLVENLSSDTRFAKYKLDEAATKPPKTSGAFNIEGLADGGNNKLLIGFRNPLRENKALVVPLENPAELVEGKAEAKFGNPIELDLKGRGVRSIERIGGSYLIVAGPYDGKKDFALFRWSGKETGEGIEEISAPAMQALFPEAIFEIPGTGEVQILSDDGTLKLGSGECKDASRAEQGFRSIILKP
ncbi:DUF3616 domain-containing protein [Bradyrhizobium sp. USDA 4529]